MNHSGFIPIPRAILSDGFWSEERAYSKAEALLYLYTNAAYAPCTRIVQGKPLDIGFGQLPGSVRFLQSAWGWSSKTKVTNFLDTVQKQGHIETEIRTGQTVITVCYLATYYKDAEEKRTAKGHGEDSKRTAEGHGEDKVKEKEDNKIKEKEESAAPILPGTTEFDLMRRIGAPAAKLWIEGEAAALFDTPAHAAAALDWLTYRCSIRKPLLSQQELSSLVSRFRNKTLADLKELIDYSTGGQYPDLYFDRLEKKTRKSSNGNRHNLDPEDLENMRQNARTTPSGVKIL